MSALKLVILALFALDAVLTVYAVRHYPNRLTEGNPVCRWFMARFGAAGGMVVLKSLAMLPLLLPQADITLQIIAAAYSALAVWNLRLILRAPGGQLGSARWP